MTTKANNYNCDGGRCIYSKGEVRVYPLGGGANLILCKACFHHENNYRFQQGRVFKRPDDFPQVDWESAEHYPS